MKLAYRSIIIILVIALVWQLLVWGFQLPDYILPGPWLVVKTWISHAGLIMQQAWPTVIETFIGFILGALFGCVSAIILIYFRPARLWFMPILIASQAIPTFAIAPLLVVWFGYGMASKIITTIIMIFFPVTSAFFDGLRSTNTEWLDLAKTMDATRWRILWRIRVPAALPALGSGLRVASVFAPIGAVVGEWVGASRGLGFLMLNANARMQIALMFAALFTLVIFALCLYFFVDRLVKYFIFWE